jgi:hypothetical protein
MILAAHGGEKKSQKKDIENARDRMKRYKTLMTHRPEAVTLGVGSRKVAKEDSGHAA